MEEKSVQQWKTLIEPALHSKEREFKLIGYKDVTTADIWHCLEKQVWKGNPKLKLHEIIKDIFRLQAGTYMNHIRIGALRTEESDLMASINALSGNNKT